MSLDQDLAAAPDVPAVFLAPHRRHGELHADILAAAVSADTAGQQSLVDPYAYQTQPTILRRLAADLAAAVPTGCDRLITEAPVGLALTAAVSLHTGLPFAAIHRPGTDTPLLHGEIHRAENLAVIHPGAPDCEAARHVAVAATAHGARVVSAHTVLADGAPNGDSTNASADSTDTGPSAQALFAEHATA
ncbi:hypothetical protein [Streptomyces sulphureus]|uniref:hypothetical protein n=1 Tax=Streptomyces sulphureus TaxID=47758 RepID=UPI00036339B6|nr:hypothetical protein [Streptomyces sulphureus]